MVHFKHYIVTFEPYKSEWMFFIIIKGYKSHIMISPDDVCIVISRANNIIILFITYNL